MAKVEFTRTKPRLWLGNGFGYAPATYAIVRSTPQTVGSIHYSASRGWVVEIAGTKIERETLAEAKAAARKSLETMP